MSESPAPRPAARSSSRSASRGSAKKAPGALDFLMIAAGVGLLGLIGLVAYRTQVQGLPIEAAIPFFSSDKNAADGEDRQGGAAGDSRYGDVPDPARRKQGGANAQAGAVVDENNTFFGRRERVGLRQPAAGEAIPSAAESSPDAASPTPAPAE